MIGLFKLDWFYNSEELWHLPKNTLVLLESSSDWCDLLLLIITLASRLRHAMLCCNASKCSDFFTVFTRFTRSSYFKSGIFITEVLGSSRLLQVFIKCSSVSKLSAGAEESCRVNSADLFSTDSFNNTAPLISNHVYYKPIFSLKILRCCVNCWSREIWSLTQTYWSELL